MTPQWMEGIQHQVDSATDTITVPDGRTLSYANFGDPEGIPVFVFHGGVGSRGFGLLFDEAASTVGIRILSPDRPGYGRSTPDPDRRVLDWPDDVSAIADANDIDRFGVLGVSGGGPYAAACANVFEERLIKSSLVSSIGPPDGPHRVPMRLLLFAARLTPRLVRFPLGRQLRRARESPEAAIESRASGKSDPEAAMHHGKAGRILTASTAEAGRQGVEWAAQEIASVARPWGFELSDISGSVDIWHGRLDRTVPVATAEHIASAIPRSNLEIRPDVGHLSLPVNYDVAILSSIADARTTR